MNKLASNEPFTPDPSAPLYSLESAAHLSGVSATLLRHYCLLGLLGEGRTEPLAEPVFDHAALAELRRIELSRQHHTINPFAIPLVLDTNGEGAKPAAGKNGERQADGG